MKKATVSGLDKELYHKYRPTNLKEMLGQEKAVKLMESFITKKKIPHALLLTGDSGCGKTTLARIIAKILGCVGTNYIEINSAKDRGIEKIREIEKGLGMMPLGGSCTVYHIDEGHKLTNDAQNAILKALEEPPPHAYFIISTTDKNKIIAAVKTRCTEIAIQPLSDNDLERLIKRTCIHEQKQIPENTVDSIVKLSKNSARKALVLLNQVIDMKPEDQLEVLGNMDVEGKAASIANLLFKTPVSFKDLQEAIKGTDDEPESIRRGILGYAQVILLSGNVKMHARAFDIINIFRDHWYDCGKPALTASCYEVSNLGRK